VMKRRGLQSVSRSRPLAGGRLRKALMNMQTIHATTLGRKAPPARWRGLSYSAYRLSRRFGFSPATASTMAELAGLRCGEGR
jgi:hypothetical protein